MEDLKEMIRLTLEVVTPQLTKEEVTRVAGLIVSHVEDYKTRVSIKYAAEKRIELNRSVSSR